MSLQSELTRLQANVTSISSSKDDIMAALASKGVTVPAGATLHDVPNLIGQIDGMAPATSTVTIGGRTYKTVRIGSQWWLAENLDYKFPVNGYTLPIGSSGYPTTPAAWYYNDNETAYGIDGTYKCGLIYNWYAAKYLDDNKDTLLPTGWHVPSYAEWDALATAVGGSSTAGTKLKALDNSVTSNWPSGWSGTDNYGFSVLPAGNRYNASFHEFGTWGVFLTLTEADNTPDYVIQYDFAYNSASTSSEDIRKTTACPLRLVRTIS